MRKQTNLITKIYDYEAIEFNAWCFVWIWLRAENDADLQLPVAMSFELSLFLSSLSSNLIKWNMNCELNPFLLLLKCISIFPHPTYSHTIHWTEISLMLFNPNVCLWDIWCKHFWASWNWSPQKHTAARHQNCTIQSRVCDWSKQHKMREHDVIPQPLRHRATKKQISKFLWKQNTRCLTFNGIVNYARVCSIMHIIHALQSNNIYIN